MNLDLVLEVAIESAHAAGAILREGARQETRPAQAKAHPHDPVTPFDRAAERAIVARLTERFPEHGILSEEGTDARPTAQYRWIIDPLDGTNNFVQGIPHYAVSIALMEQQAPRVACIYDPIREERFTAVVGQGARINERPIAVSSHEGLDGITLAVGYSIWPERRRRLHDMAAPLLDRARAIRTTGSAALDLAYVAAGRFDATWYLSLSPWDVAAGILLIREAGGRVTDLTGVESSDPEGGVLATNGRLHPAMIHIASGQVAP